mgnify:CR=1 FL=1
MSFATMTYDGVISPWLVHVTVTTLAGSIQIAVRVKERPEQSFRLVMTVGLWTFKPLHMIQRHDQPVVTPEFERAVQALLVAQQFLAQFSLARAAFQRWCQTTPP